MRLCLVIACFGYSVVSGKEPETLPALEGGQPPRNLEQMWRGFAPRAEPLEVETIREWEEDEVVLRIVRFRIGVFKGEKATLAAVYGFPRRLLGTGEKIPGLVQIHGGGQYADYRACLLNAQHGYATISIAWAGRISAPGYRVDPKVVRLFWEGMTDDPAYKLTTDWGAVDGYHAPGRNAGNAFPSAKSAAWTLDATESPRNSGWFLCTMAARRALTFLEQQPEVDPDKLGVYGHSMGGKLTVLTSVDARVKAAAPSVVGSVDRSNKSPLFRSTLGDDVSLKEIACPIIFLSPSNDFHGRIGDLPRAVDEIKSQHWRVTCSPHGSHQDSAQFEVATLLWFDQHLKGSFAFPKTPNTELQLENEEGTPTISIHPDSSHRILSVDVFYTQHGKYAELPSDRENTKSRFWRHAHAIGSADELRAQLPLTTVDKPLWVYANVTYALKQPVSGAGYYYRPYKATTFNVSSLLQKAAPERLRAAGVKANPKRSLMIESFADGWEKEWFTYRPDQWPRATHKVYDQQYHAPGNARLQLQVNAAQRNKLVILIDEYAAVVDINNGEKWQDIVLTTSDFSNHAGVPLPGWDGIRELKLSDTERLKPARGRSTEARIVGKTWRGPNPRFRKLRWVTDE